MASSATTTAQRDEDDAIRAAADRVAAQGECAPRTARDPVNLPMIHNWVEALGDNNPVYTSEELAASSVHGELVAPPAMAQVWTMGGLRPEPDPENPLHAMMTALDEAGFTSVVATNCDQTYHRYLRHGERVTVTGRLEEVVGPKRTALGEGWFVTSRDVWYVDAEPVAEMLFRVLKFRPDGHDEDEAHDDEPKPSGADESSTYPSTAAQGLIRPAVNRGTAYFWQGTAEGELRIQRCGGCGLLRHPPGPMCPECGRTSPTYLVASGLGEIYSYVVHHRPEIPGKELPLVVALVELDEGVRVLGEMPGVDPDSVHIGQRVEVAYQRVDDDLVLPVWKPSAQEEPS